MRITYYHFQSVDSTNAFAKRNRAHLSHDECAIIGADEQTQGIGTKGRTWLAQKGSSLCLSFAFFNTANDPFFFTQLASLSCEAVLSKFGVTPRIKWPNDLLVDNKKIVGILAEAVFTQESKLIIIGIGMNVNQTKEDLAGIGQPATSIFAETGKTYPIAMIQEEVVKQFFEHLKLDPEIVQSRWREKMVTTQP